MALKAIIVVIMLLVVFEAIGMAFSSIIKRKQHIAFNLLYGYMIYFSMFEVVYLICLAVKNDLKLIGIMWTTVVIVTFITALFISRRVVPVALKNLAGFMAEKWKQMAVAMVLTLVVILIYVLGVSYVTEDSYSYACIGDAVTTGKMFMRDVYTGTDRQEVDITYALSGYYMHSAVVCKVMRLSAICVQHNIMGVITILMSVNVIYLLGRELLGNRAWMVAGLIMLYEAANIYLLLYSDERYFLLTGAYDELSQIPYILIPVMVLGFVEILRNDDISGWSKVILCGIAGCAVSVSSIMVIPAAILCGAITATVCKKDTREMAISGVSLIPCVIYIIIYCVCSRG